MLQYAFKSTNSFLVFNPIDSTRVSKNRNFFKKKSQGPSCFAPKNICPELEPRDIFLTIKYQHGCINKYFKKRGPQKNNPVKYFF